jgi:hypothetical protein
VAEHPRNLNEVAKLLGGIAESVFWFSLWAGIPAALLYPGARWMLIHTHYSESFLIQSYGISVSILFLPTGFLVDFLYRRFILKKRSSS